VGAQVEESVNNAMGLEKSLYQDLERKNKMEKYKIVSFIPQPSEVQYPWVVRNIDPSSVDFVVAPQVLSEDQVCELVSDCNMIIASPVMPYLNEKILETANKLERVQFASVGYDKIDLVAADKLGIPVANNAGINAVTVAEHTLMMILVLQRKGFMIHEEVIKGSWPECKPGDLWELRGRTVGILGLGAIGTELAKLVRPFGVHILYNKRNRLSVAEENSLGVEYRPLADLIKESDILSIHVPLNSETRHIIGAKEIESMKTGAILINTARKDVLDEEAAAKALASGKLYGVGVDVPKTCDDRAVELKNLFEGYNSIITSHTASASSQLMERFCDRLSTFVYRAQKGEPPLYPVNNSGITTRTKETSNTAKKHELEQIIVNAGLDKSSISKFFKNETSKKRV